MQHSEHYQAESGTVDPIEPKSGAWYRNPFDVEKLPTHHQVWDNLTHGFRVIATVERLGRVGFVHHLSISESGERYPQPWVIEQVKRDFGAGVSTQADCGSTVAHLWVPAGG